MRGRPNSRTNRAANVRLARRQETIRVETASGKHVDTVLRVPTWRTTKGEHLTVTYCKSTFPVQVRNDHPSLPTAPLTHFIRLGTEIRKGGSE